MSLYFYQGCFCGLAWLICASAITTGWRGSADDLGWAVSHIPGSIGCLSVYYGLGWDKTLEWNNSGPCISSSRRLAQEYSHGKGRKVREEDEIYKCLLNILLTLTKASHVLRIKEGSCSSSWLEGIRSNIAEEIDMGMGK